MIIDFLVLPTLYRIAGSDLKIPKKKLLRRLGIPLYLFLTLPRVEVGLGCLLLGIIFTFNLDEIEERDWDDVLCYGLAISFCLTPLAGFISCLVGFWWLIGVLLSNIGINKWRLPWRWVEIGMGIAIALAINL